MKSKQLTVLAAAAVVLAGAAYTLSSGSKPSGAKLNGRALFPKLALSEVARVEVGDKLKLAAGDGGWVVETFHGYPADHAKLAENLLKLSELKVGQVVRGKKLDAPDTLVLKDAAGKALATLPLGEKHPKWGFGRYVAFEGETVLVSDTLEAFDGDPKRWCETKIADEPWISFTSLADSDAPDDVTGFSTGVVARVTAGGDTNCVATVGNALPDGSGRYFRLDGKPWVYVVPSYSVERLLPKEETGAEAPRSETEEGAEAPRPETEEGAEAAQSEEIAP